MSNELVGFFTIIMNDLDDREKRCTHDIQRLPHKAEKLQEALIHIKNIKVLMLNRARQFGLVVNDDQETIEEERLTGVADMEAYAQRLKKLDPRILIHLGEY
ncbi:hypothetical protein [Vibrio cincinnatiensis]|uniref:hypothetical protein n=1 Tax=Vibrio cincinnatiensis TaxID=675 RepID=UPI001FAA1BDB|nr:hypothetical protein [Vibrio cincinnatiensis]